MTYQHLLGFPTAPWATGMSPHSRLEGAGGHELGDEDDALLALEGGLPRVVEADDVGVLQPLQHLRFLLEPLLLRLGQLPVLGEVGVEVGREEEEKTTAKATPRLEGATEKRRWEAVRWGKGSTRGWVR